MNATAQLPRPGDMIAGKYVLDRLLGQGGMGAVFAARHLKLAKHVAIKIMLADASNPEASQRFINEGRAAANIQNEHVVRVDDVDEEMGYAYMVLELLEGQDLAQLLDASASKRIAPHLAVSYVVQGLRGVAQAHALGIVHRDLKPSNLFLAKRKDGTAVVKVLDFGISKATANNALNQAPSALTSTKAMLGSPLYMSPEQLRNAKGVDHRADIWAMGVILYELITGSLPFMGDNLGELFAAILETDPIPLAQRAGASVPQGLNDVVTRCLQRKPEQRYQSAAELMHALAPFEQPGMGGTAVGLGGTAFMPNGAPNANIQTGPIPSSPHLPNPQAISSSATGPQPQRPVSQPNVPGQFHQTTGSGWQQGSAVSPAIPKSKMPLVIAVGVAVALVFGVVGVLLVIKSGGDKTTGGHHEMPSASLSAEAPPPTVAATTVKAPDPAPTESVAVVAPSASVSVPTPMPAVAPVAVPNHKPTVSHPLPAPQPQPVAQPTPPAPAPAPKPGPKNTPGLQDSR